MYDMNDIEEYEYQRLAVMICPYCGSTRRKDVNKTSYGFMVTCLDCGEILLEDGPSDELDEFI